MSVDSTLDMHPSDASWGHGIAQDADGLRLHYVRQGHGRPGHPVLLLHGWPGFWYDWRRILPTVAQFAEVIALDLRGFGDSAKPDWPPREAYSPEAQTRNVLALLDQLQLNSVILVGYDVGSRVAQEVARNAPQRVHALVLAAPVYPGFGARPLQWEAQQQRWYQHFHNIPQADLLIGHDRETVRLYLSYFYDHWVGNKEAVRPKEFEAIVETYAQPGAVRASIAWYRAGAGSAQAAVSSQATATIPPPIAHPTAVVWGEVDAILPSAWSDRLADYFSRLISVRVLPGIGHFVPFESPDAVVEAIGSVAE